MENNFKYLKYGWFTNYLKEKCDLKKVYNLSNNYWYVYLLREQINRKKERNICWTNT